MGLETFKFLTIFGLDPLVTVGLILQQTAVALANQMAPPQIIFAMVVVVVVDQSNSSIELHLVHAWTPI